MQCYAQRLVPKAVEVCAVQRMRSAVPPAIPRRSARRLFIDVSIVAGNDAGTGIQRIVRAIGAQLPADPSADWKIHFMAASRARSYEEISWPNVGLPVSEKAEPGKPGDVFLGLDFVLDAVPRHRRQILKWKAEGVAIWFVVYDLLPIQHPEWFSDQLVARFRRWLRVIAGMADGFLCISHPVDQDLRRIMTDRYGLSDDGFYKSAVIPMGWDLGATRPSVGLSPDFPATLEKLVGRRFALMVGTLEPRKGHEDILDAFEALWRDGGEDRLVIVGRPGWKTRRLQRRLSKSPDHGSKLFWLCDASDEALEHLYRLCTGVVVASYGEGFGLPLIEALGHRKPVMARDIPIFHSHASAAVHYFNDMEPAALGKKISQWMKDIEGDSPPFTVPASWSDACSSIKIHLEGGEV